MSKRPRDEDTGEFLSTKKRRTKAPRKKPRVSPLQDLKKKLREKEKNLRANIRDLNRQLRVVQRDRKQTSKCR